MTATLELESYLPSKLRTTVASIGAKTVRLEVAETAFKTAVDSVSQLDGNSKGSKPSEKAGRESRKVGSLQQDR